MSEELGLTFRTGGWLTGNKLTQSIFAQATAQSEDNKPRS